MFIFFAYFFYCPLLFIRVLVLQWRLVWLLAMGSILFSHLVFTLASVPVTGSIPEAFLWGGRAHVCGEAPSCLAARAGLRNVLLTVLPVIYRMLVSTGWMLLSIVGPHRDLFGQTFLCLLIIFTQDWMSLSGGIVRLRMGLGVCVLIEWGSHGSCASYDGGCTCVCVSATEGIQHRLFWVTEYFTSCHVFTLVAGL